MKGVLVLVSILCSIAAGYCGEWIEDDITYTNTYMILTALAWFFILVSVRLFAEGRYLKILTECASLLAFSQVLDEVFFNPVIIAVNDYALLIMTVLWGGVRMIRR